MKGKERKGKDRDEFDNDILIDNGMKCVCIYICKG